MEKTQAPIAAAIEQAFPARPIYTAIECAAALVGKVHAWHVFNSLVRQTQPLMVAADGSNTTPFDMAVEQVTKDVRAEIARSPAATNSRKGAGKTLSNFSSVLRRAHALGVAIYAGDKLASVGGLEKACKAEEEEERNPTAAQGGADDSGASDDSGAADTVGAGAESDAASTLAIAIAMREVAEQALAAMTAERDALAAKLQAIADCANYKAVRKVLEAA